MTSSNRIEVTLSMDDNTGNSVNLVSDCDGDLYMPEIEIEKVRGG
jgi:hypothetical protein